MPLARHLTKLAAILQMDTATLQANMANVAHEDLRDGDPHPWELYALDLRQKSLVEAGDRVQELIAKKSHVSIVAPAAKAEDTGLRQLCSPSQEDGSMGLVVAVGAAKALRKWVVGQEVTYQEFHRALSEARTSFIHGGAPQDVEITNKGHPGFAAQQARKAKVARAKALEVSRAAQAAAAVKPQAKLKTDPESATK